VTGTDIKKLTLTIDIFQLSLNRYLFVIKGKITSQWERVNPP
jgi:hypothetical protein